MKNELNMITVSNLYTETYNVIQSHYSILNNMHYKASDMLYLMQSFTQDYSNKKEILYKTLSHEDANILVDMLELKADEYYNKFARIYSLKHCREYID